jgi:hypothetical protein
MPENLHAAQQPVACAVLREKLTQATMHARETETVSLLAQW